MRCVRAALCFAALVLAAASARAQTCDAPAITLLVDQSTSMNADFGGDDIDKSKWDIVAGSLLGLVAGHDAGTRFGLTVMPELNGNCNQGGRSLLAPALESGPVIEDALDAWAPTANSWSPIGQTFAEMRPEALGDAVVFISDGVQSCPLLEGPESQWPLERITDAVAELPAHGVTVYIVGFGNANPTVPGDDKADGFALNQLAVAGGAPRPDCDPTGKVFGGQRSCYYYAAGEAALAAALEEIAAEIEHVCNGECTPGQTRDCGTGEGACSPGKQTCGDDHAWGACKGGVGPADEICDGKDNDCDGQIDDGVTRDCGEDEGECSPGKQTCSAGVWGTCKGAVGPTPEVCDGKDNDCDGTTDPGCAPDCQPGQQRACGGPDIGVCRSGTQTCGAEGDWGACQGAVGPTAEVCDGLDNDCDGQLDEGCGCTAGQTRACGSPAVGECRPGTQTCTAGGAWGECTGGQGPTAEICDGKDNDCDGTRDPGCACPEGDTRICGYPDSGTCRAGAQTCEGGQWGACAGTVGPTAELCDGLDNDCDGMVNEAQDGVCPAAFVCREARCVASAPVTGDGGGDDEGGGCRTARGGGGAAAGPLLLLLAALALRRRR